MNPQRRLLLVQALASAGLYTLLPAQAMSAAVTLIANVTGLYSVTVAKVETPLSGLDVARAVRDWPGKICVGGGRYSMGGQTGFPGGLHLDMRKMNKLVWLNREARTVRVQAGMRWRDLQDVLDPACLAVMTMQSYSNFTIGGSVSVNAHGRYVGNGPVGNSVRSLQLVLANGSVIEASRLQNNEIFRSALGGYGAIGVITEVELDLAINTAIERTVSTLTLQSYPEYFRTSVRNDHLCVFHNADLLPPQFDVPVASTWRTTSKPVTEPARLIPRGQSYSLNQDIIFAVTELPGGASLHTRIAEMLLAKPAVVWRNYEASFDVAELEPWTRRISTYVLQEYFIPVGHFEAFARDMATVIQQYGVEVLNVSIRHSPSDQVAMLPWSKVEVFSFVVYFKQRTSERAKRHIADWTRAMIDAALKYDGRYYLPYQLHATKAQFEKSYPEVAQFRMVKNNIDPEGKFSNELWLKYI